MSRVLEFIQDITERLEQEAELKRREEQLRSLLNSMTNSLLLLDIVRDEKGKPIDFVVTDANPAYCATFDTSMDELRDRSFLVRGNERGVLSTDFGEQWRKGLELAAEGIGGSYHIEIPNVPTAPYQEAIVFPAGKKQIGLLLYDETFRVRSDKKLRMMQLIIDRISQPVIWLFPNGTIQYANDSGCRADARRAHRRKNLEIRSSVFSWRLEDADCWTFNGKSPAIRYRHAT